MADKNKELMLARGSKTGAYDADAPDQWKYDLRHGEGEVKALAWVKSKTIALNHESPFCVDEHGNALLADHMAVELGWELQTARNVLGSLEVKCRIRIEKGKRIWYRADVPGAYEPAAVAVKEETQEEPTGEEPDSDDPQPEPEDDTKYSVQSIWGTYVADFISSIPRRSRRPAIAKLKACEKWKREFLADGMAELRTIVERVEDTTLLEIGVPKKRLPKRREPEHKWVQLKLLAEPDFVQGAVSELVSNSVQSTVSGLYKVENGSYTPKNGAASLYTATATAKTLERAVAEPLSRSGLSSSSTPISRKNGSVSSRNGDDDEKPKTEYASGRDHLKAIYHAKTGEFAPVDLIDRIERILVGQGKTFEEFAEALGPHLGGTWKIPGAFLTDKARKIFAPRTGPPELKPKPKCPTCKADNQRGAIMREGSIVPCPDCSTEEWREELAAKLSPKAKGAAN